MSTPTVTSVQPAAGHSGGRTLVQVAGSGFRLPPDPPASGPAPVPGPTVRVLFGGAPATHVQIIDAATLLCLTPPGDPDAGARDVTVTNLDPWTGAAVPSETATRAAAFTFKRPDLSEESELARVVRALLRLLKQQIVENVHVTTHTDYDSTTGDSLNLAFVEKLPALVLTELEVPEDRAQAQQGTQDFPADYKRFIERRPALVVDVTAQLVGVTNDPVELLNLMQATRLCFRKTPWLVLDRDKDDPTQGTVQYELDFSFGGPVSVTRAADNSNVSSFAGAIVVRGVLLEDIPGLPKDKPPGIPAHYPHEGTVGYGWQADETAAKGAAK